MRTFFIVGCQRSGTTLLRLVLNSHPQVFCYDEGKGYWALKNKRLPDSQGIELVGYKIPRWTEQLDFDLVYDVGHGLWTTRFYTGQPIIFLVRDVRDVVASMSALMYGPKNWWEEWGIERLLINLGSDTFRNFFSEEIDRIGDLRKNLFGAASLYWKFKMHSLYYYALKQWPILPVLYEKLVADPKNEIRRITTFLGLRWDDALLAHWQQSHSELDEEGKAVGKTDVSRAIDSASVGKWRVALEADALETVESVAGTLNKALQNEDFTVQNVNRFPFERYSQERLEMVLNFLVAKEELIERARYSAINRSGQ